MKRYIKRPIGINIKSMGIGLVLLGLGLFLYKELQPFITDYFAYRDSDSTPFIKISYPEVQPEKLISPIDISQISFEQLEEFATNDYNYPVFGREGIAYEIVYNGNKISHLQLSPDQKKIGFYVYPFDKVLKDEETSLVIMDLNKKSLNEIIDVDDKFSNWGWRDNNTVDIGINCGSSCHYTQVTSIEDGKIIAQYFKGQKFNF